MGSTERELRVPLYVPVRCDRGLRNCWAVNLSKSGLGLVAGREPNQPPIVEEQTVRVDFSLPGSGARVRGLARVSWLYEAPSSHDPSTGISLGVRFTKLQESDALKLARYLHAYRPHVAVAYASGSERKLVERVLGNEAVLHFGDTHQDVLEILERGDIATIVVCGDDENRALELLGWVASIPEGLQGISTASDLLPRVVYCAAGRAESLVEEFNHGRIYSVVSRPLDSTILPQTVLRACGDHGLRTEQHRVALALELALAREQSRERLRPRPDAANLGGLIPKSAATRRLIELVEVVAPHRTSVLLQGETGTGKEVVGRLIHARSDRSDATFVVQDCGALSETLLESELFGHVKGAFTGAISSNPGLFVIADGGTIMLDEIQNASGNVQAKLLRAIETGEIRPIGQSISRRVDVRVIAASNRDLAEDMRLGRMRPDLYFRLAAFPIALGPLRERREEILPLASIFIGEANRALGKNATGFSSPAEGALTRYSWPGNVRELKHTVERAVLLSKPNQPLDLDLLPDAIRQGSPNTPDASGGPGSLQSATQALERRLIEEALARHGGVTRRAAKELGLNPVTLGRKINKYKLHH